LERGAKITTMFCQNNTIDASKRPTKKFESKGESIVEYKLGRITRDQGVHITNCTKNLFVNLNNKIMFME
jgi:hypothetical protein